MFNQRLDEKVQRLQALKRDTTAVFAKAVWLRLAPYDWIGPFDNTGAPMRVLHEIIDVCIQDEIPLTITARS